MTDETSADIALLVRVAREAHDLSIQFYQLTDYEQLATRKQCFATFARLLAQFQEAYKRLEERRLKLDTTR